MRPAKAAGVGTAAASTGDAPAWGRPATRRARARLASPRAARAAARLAAAALLPGLAACGGEAIEPRGVTGVTEVELALPAGSGEPNLAVLADGRVALTWHEPAEGSRSALRLALRSDSGWSRPTTVRESDLFFVNWADFPSFVETADGAWAVHWLEKVAEATYAYHVRLSLSTDGGRTWSDPVTPHRDGSPTEHGFVSMVPWGEREVALVWLDGREMAPADGAAGDHGPSGTGPMTLRFTTLGSDGARGRELLVDGRTCECCQTSLARAARGLVVAYRDRGPEEIRDIRVVRYEGGAWTEPVAVADDGWRIAGCPVNGPQLDADGDRVVVAWFTGAEGRAAVKAAFSEDGGATFGRPVRVDEGAPVGRVDVVLLEDGAAAVAWLERKGEGAAVQVRRVGADGLEGEPARVSGTSAGRASGFPRVVRTGEGLVVAWTVPGAGGGVRVATLPLE